MAIINQGSSPRELQDGVNAIAGALYEAYKPEWSSYLSEIRSDKSYEVDVYKTPMRSARLKTEGGDIFTDTTEQLYKSIFTNAVYGIGAEASYESLKNNRYTDIMKELGRQIERSLQEAEQIIAADVVNSGYTSFLAGDGVSVFNTAHVLGKGGGTFANRFSGYVQLSEAALEDACTAVSRFVDASGKRIGLKPVSLEVPPDLEFTACRLLDSNLQADTANNAVNAINKMGKFSKGYSTNHYFTDTGAWFVCTNADNGGKFFRREDHQFKSDNSNTNTWNYRHTGITYFSVGVTDPRAYFGSGPSA